MWDVCSVGIECAACTEVVKGTIMIPADMTQLGKAAFALTQEGRR